MGWGSRRRSLGASFSPTHRNGATQLMSGPSNLGTSLSPSSSESRICCTREPHVTQESALAGEPGRHFGSCPAHPHTALAPRHMLSLSLSLSLQVKLKEQTPSPPQKSSPPSTHPPRLHLHGHPLLCPDCHHPSSSCLLHPFLSLLLFPLFSLLERFKASMTLFPHPSLLN